MLTNIKIENLVFLLLLFGIISCKSDIKDKKVRITEPAKIQESVPISDQAFVQDLFNRVDQIDYIYNSFDFSMSISEPNAIKSNIATLSGIEIGPIPANCKPVGRQMFMAKGEMLAEADLYFSEDCQFLVFVEKEKPVSGSTFNQRGIDFYKQVFAQAAGATSQ